MYDNSEYRQYEERIVPMNESHITLSEVLKHGQLQDFILQQESLDLKSLNKHQLDEMLK